MERMPERKKMIIHFTDGAPDYLPHVVEAVRKSRLAGIKVYAIGMGHYARSLEGQYGPGNWEVITTVAELPHAVARLIKRLDSFK